ncbi:MAG: hypothetical protein WAW90_02350 [Minisyncoccia bacterium]
MRTPDLDRARSEEKRTLADFVELYNENLPTAFPRASAELLKEFRSGHMGLFPAGKGWSLDQHRRKVMDWLRTNAVLAGGE